MKKLSLSRAFGGAALALALGLGLHGGAWAQQTINLNAPLTLTYDVCGNAADTATGNCGTTNGPNGNTLNINSGVDMAGHLAYGGYDNSTTAAVSATGNTVNFNGSGADMVYVYGANAVTTAAGKDAAAENNKATVGADAALAGIWASVDGGRAAAGDGGTATATGNVVEMTGGAVSGIPSLSGSIAGGVANAPGGTPIASNNRVSISGGTLSNVFIYGGIPGYSGTGAASDNTVEIKGSAVMGEGVSLQGAEGCRSGSTCTGNALELYLKSVVVEQLAYFDKLNFHVPASLTAGQTMLAVTSGVALDSPTVSVEIESGSPLAVGDQIVLIDASAGSVSVLPGPLLTAVTSLTPGYTFGIVDSFGADKKLVVEVTAVPAGSPPVLTLPHVRGFAATSAYFNVTSDIPADGYWRVISQASVCPTATAIIATHDGSGPVAAGANDYTLTGLTPGTDYKVCFVADNSGASSTAEATFSTAPPATAITSAAVTVAAPRDGNAPSAAATPASGSHFTASAVTWSPADNPFKAGTSYTATVTLTAEAGYTFAGLAAANATLNGQAASSISVSAAGDAVTITYVFPPLAPRGGSGGGVASVPTLGELALALLALLLTGGAAAGLRRQK